jgi:hypothetical protein
MPPCPAGKYRIGANATSNYLENCSPCPGGTYSPVAGALSEAACIKCPLRTFAPEGTGGRTACLPCPPGTITLAVGSLSCFSLFETCPAGKQPIAPALGT